MIKLIIFDFDGTLANTRQIVSDSIHNSLIKNRYSSNKSQISKVIGHADLPGTLIKLGVTIKDIKMVVNDVRMSVNSAINKIKPTCELDYLEEIKLKRMILSNSDSSIIKKILNLWGIKFNFVSGAEDGISKLKRFKQILKNNKIKPSEVIYFGDLDIDVKLAKTIGCYSAVVLTKHSWGSSKSLIEANPDFIICNLKDVKNLIDKINHPS